MTDPTPPRDRAHSSRQRYADFVEEYRHKRLDDATDSRAKELKASPSANELVPTNEKDRKTKRRRLIRDYLRWLKPHRGAITFVFLLALVVAGLQMIEPLFM